MGETTAQPSTEGVEPISSHPSTPDVVEDNGREGVTLGSEKCCAFCLKKEGEVKTLTCGKTPNVHICEKCIIGVTKSSFEGLCAAYGRDQVYRYRYHWRAIYEDGSEFPQFDEEGEERSVARLDWGRVTSLKLEPQLPGFPPVEVLVNREIGEQAIKFWQVTRSAGLTEGLIDIREVVGLKRSIPKQQKVRFFVLLCADGRILISSSENT